jgi:cobalt-zinc-cadmium efflux system membrane fusion protein
MKMKIFYSITGIALLMSSIVAWQFWSSSPLKKETASLEIAEANPHGHIDEHGHSEENIIPLSSDQIKDLGIQTKIAGPGELSVTISTRGKIILHPDKLAHILPKISGVAKEARKNIGDRVKEGEVLAILESREMADIKANYLAAKEKESLALSLLDREKRLHEKKVSAEQDYLNAKSAYVEAKINVQLSEQKLHAFGIEDEEIKELSNEHNPDLRLYDIRSPMDGIVIARHINKGEFIENTTTIYEIADLSIIWIEIGIYPKDLVRVKEGQMVDISLPVDGKIAQAKIIYLSPIIQDETITAKAVAELTNPSGNWRPGSFVKVNIATENVFVPLVISKEAIQEIEGKDFVFVKVPEGFEKRQTQVGVSDDKNVEILSGLSAGEEYASSKTFLLKADLSKKEAEHEH